MSKRNPNRRFLACAALLLLTFPGVAAAQSESRVHVPDPEQVPSIAQLFSPWRPAFVPVRIGGLDVPDQLVAGEPGTFAAQVNLESATLPLHGQWDFGDGTTVHGLHARHTYARTGTYTVTFTLRNAGSEAVDSTKVHVLPVSSDAAADVQPEKMSSL